jgi:dephospho-CoA kinase
MKRPYCVALTGGIGSGKSLVARRFGELGVEVIDTDVISRQLTASDGAAMPAIRAGFGADFIASDGGLDRVRMRERVFADPVARGRLEAILHPLIRDRVAETVAASPAPYVLIVVPLLLETGAYGDLADRILVVDCEPAQQIERVVRRDGMPETTARAVLAAQIDRTGRLAAADDVIDNRGDPASLVARVAELHRAYLDAAAARRA